MVPDAILSDKARVALMRTSPRYRGQKKPRRSAEFFLNG